MTGILLAPVLVQAAVMLADEGFCHRRRGLPRWERIGHPCDTLTLALCYGWLVVRRPEALHAAAIYVGLSLFSCLFVTKDEFIHAHVCSPMEHWLHSVLFLMHPIVLLSFGLLWISGTARWVFQAQFFLTLAFGTYQTLYWNRTWTRLPNRSAP